MKTVCVRVCVCVVVCVSILDLLFYTFEYHCWVRENLCSLLFWVGILRNELGRWIKIKIISFWIRKYKNKNDIIIIMTSIFQLEFLYFLCDDKEIWVCMFVCDRFGIIDILVLLSFAMIICNHFLLLFFFVDLTIYLEKVIHHIIYKTLNWVSKAVENSTLGSILLIICLELFLII